MAEPAAAADNGVPAAEHDDDDVEELEEEPAAAALQPVDQNQGVVVVSNFKGKPCPNLDENGQPCGRLLNGRAKVCKKCNNPVPEDLFERKKPKPKELVPDDHFYTGIGGKPPGITRNFKDNFQKQAERIMQSKEVQETRKMFGCNVQVTLSGVVDSNTAHHPDDTGALASQGVIMKLLDVKGHREGLKEKRIFVITRIAGPGKDILTADHRLNNRIKHMALASQMFVEAEVQLAVVIVQKRHPPPPPAAAAAAGGAAGAAAAAGGAAGASAEPAPTLQQQQQPAAGSTGAGQAGPGPAATTDIAQGAPLPPQLEAPPAAAAAAAAVALAETEEPPAAAAAAEGQVDAAAAGSNKQAGGQSTQGGRGRGRGGGRGRSSGGRSGQRGQGGATRGHKRKAAESDMPDAPPPLAPMAAEFGAAMFGVQHGYDPTAATAAAAGAAAARARISFANMSHSNLAAPLAAGFTTTGMLQSAAPAGLSGFVTVAFGLGGQAMTGMPQFAASGGQSGFMQPSAPGGCEDFVPAAFGVEQPAPFAFGAGSTAATSVAAGLAEAAQTMSLMLREGY